MSKTLQRDALTVAAINSTLKVIRTNVSNSRYKLLDFYAEADSCAYPRRVAVFLALNSLYSAHVCGDSQFAVLVCSKKRHPDMVPTGTQSLLRMTLKSKYTSLVV